MTTGKTRGRKARYSAKMVRTSSTLPDYMHRYLQDLGEGNASEGIRKAINLAWEQSLFHATALDDQDMYGRSVEAIRSFAVLRVESNPALLEHLDVLVPPIPSGEAIGADGVGASTEEYSDDYLGRYINTIYAPEGWLIEFAIKQRAERPA